MSDRSSFDCLLDALRDAGCRVDEHGDRAQAQAPGHSPADRSLSIRYLPAEGRCLVNTFGSDSADDVLAALGLGFSSLYDAPLRRDDRTPDHRVRRTIRPVHRPATDMELAHRAEHRRDLREADRIAAEMSGYTTAQIRAERARLIELGDMR